LTGFDIKASIVAGQRFRKRIGRLRGGWRAVPDKEPAGEMPHGLHRAYLNRAGRQMKIGLLSGPDHRRNIMNDTQGDLNYRQQSFWLDSIPESLEPRPRLEQDVEADVAIVGAGYTGLWTAWYLKQHDPRLNIVVLESEIAGFGASGRNGGWCSSFLSGIDKWLDDPQHREGAIRLQRQMFDAVAEVGRVAERESIDCHFEQAGALEMAVRPGQMPRLREELEYVQGLGFGDEDYRWLSSEQCRDMINVDQALGGFLLSHCAAIHPARLARGLADAVERRQVKLYERSAVTELGQGWVRTARAKVKAETIVLATEGYTGTLPGHRRRLVPMHSRMVVTEPLNAEQLEAVGSRRRYTFGNLDHIVTYGQLTADKRIAFGCRGSYLYGGKIQHFDQADPEFDITRETLIRFFPALEGIRFTHAWGGAMGVSRSLRPFVTLDRPRGLAWAGGYFGNGVGAANLAGRTLADLLLDRDSERLHTPWVNPATARRVWEPEPLRWLGVSTRKQLMQMADRAEYSGSGLAPVINKTLNTLFP
jgi:glycine/D-amino acid oxidase-like deaminating enzyme